MFEPSSRSATVLSAVKTGAITTSQWFAFATRGFNSTAVRTESAMSLYIFQFPAMTGLRIVFGFQFSVFGFSVSAVERFSVSDARVRTELKTENRKLKTHL